MDGKPITRAFLEGFMMHDEDIIEIVNAYVNIDNAIGIIEDMTKPESEFSEIKQLLDELDATGNAGQVIEINSEDYDAPGLKMDVFVYIIDDKNAEDDKKTIAFISHHDHVVAFWN